MFWGGGEFGVTGGWLSMGALRLHRMSGFNQVVQAHGVVRHVDCSSHFGIVLSWGWECWFPTFMSVASSVFLV
jgi:hypothetical protein